jgi:hypothetical protein
MNNLITVLFLLPNLALMGSETGFVSLFDGQSLNGWVLVKRVGPGYVIKDGNLVCPADGGGNLFTQKEYSNFVLRFEFEQTLAKQWCRIRALRGDAAYVGMEVQILDDTASVYREARPARYHSSMMSFLPDGHLKAESGTKKKSLPTAVASHVKLNGTIIVDGCHQRPETLKKHLAWPTSSHIGFWATIRRLSFKYKIEELP